MSPIFIFISIMIAVFLQGIALYYFTYWKKKGENLATKEDLIEITSLVENIRGEVGILMQSQIGFRGEMRSAMIHYNEVLSRSLSNAGWEVFSGDTHNELFADFIKNTFPTYMAARSRLMLFVDDARVQKLVNEISDEFMEVCLENHTYAKTLSDRKKPAESGEVRSIVKEYTASIGQRNQNLHRNHSELLKIFRELLSK